MSADPRRLMVADLAARLAAGLTGQAQAYESAAGRADGSLRDALETLGRAKGSQAADLAAVARSLGGPAPVPTAPCQPSGVLPRWGVILGEAFQGERNLEGMSLELAGLTEDPGVRARALGQAAAAGRDGAAVRKLYLQYS